MAAFGRKAHLLEPIMMSAYRRWIRIDSVRIMASAQILYYFEHSSELSALRVVHFDIELKQFLTFAGGLLADQEGFL